MDRQAEIEYEVETLQKLCGRAYCELFRLKVAFEHAEMAYDEIEVENKHLQ